MPDQLDTWPSTGCYEDIRLANSCLCPPAVGQLFHGLVPLMPKTPTNLAQARSQMALCVTRTMGWQEWMGILTPSPGSPGWQGDEFWLCVGCL